MAEEFPSHVDWLLQHRGAPLETALRAGGTALSAVDALRVLMAADPSPKKVATQWLTDTFIAGGYLWEDVAGGAESKAAETLGWFAENRSNLRGPARHIGNYRTLAEVYKATGIELRTALQDDKAGAALVGRALRRSEREAARADSMILHESAELTVAVPLTREASCWWGRGTRWCTAAARNNAFATYDRDGPLIVILLPDTKLQLFVCPGRTIQFMHASDAAVGPDFIDEHWDLLAPLMEWTVARNADFLSHIPLPRRTSAMCSAALERDPMAVKAFPAHLLTEQIYLAAVRRNPEALGMGPANWRSREVCLAAVSDCGPMLRHVPDDVVDEEICAAAVVQSPMALQAVPERLVTQAICLAAVSRDGAALRHVPAPAMTYDVCAAAVRQTPSALSIVPRALMDSSMCEDAVARDGHMFQYVPPRVVTGMMAWHAIKQDPALIRRIPPSKLTDGMCLWAVSRRPSVLEYVPEARRTPELCQVAVDKDPLALSLVPESVRTASMCERALEREPVLLQLVPHALSERQLRMAMTGEPGSLLTPTLRQAVLEQVALDPHWAAWALRKVPGFWRHLVEGRGVALGMVPKKARTPDVCRVAVSQDGNALEFVPEDAGSSLFRPGRNLRTASLCMAAVRQRGSALAFVPVSLRTEALLLAALRRDGGQLALVPENARTARLCRAAVLQAPSALLHVPPALRSKGMCMSAVTRAGLMLEHVPGGVMDAQICAAAIRQNPDATAFVPRTMAARLRQQPSTGSDALPMLLGTRREMRGVRAAAFPATCGQSQSWTPDLALAGLADVLAQASTARAARRAVQKLARIPA